MAKKKPVLGKWELLETLGRGGMGAVYLARHVDLGRKAAVKVMAPLRKAKSDRVALEYLERFRREIVTLSRFRHPNLPCLYDFDLDGEHPYFAQEFIDGEDLHGFRACAFAERRGLAVDALHALAGALEQLHGAGIFHRDVKSANVIRAEDGRMVLVDMGLVKLSDVTTLTKEGAAVGTARYMPPELLLGGSFDARSDLYLAGLVALELVDVDHPFLGSDFKEVLALKMTEERLLPSPDLREALHPAFLDLLGRLTALDPAQRPATARALAEELSHVPRDGAPRGPIASSGIAPDGRIASRTVAPRATVPPATARGGRSDDGERHGDTQACTAVDPTLLPGPISTGLRGPSPDAGRSPSRLPRRALAAVLLSLVLMASAAAWRWGGRWLRAPGGPAAGDMKGLHFLEGERHLLVRWTSEKPYAGAIRLGDGAGASLTEETRPGLSHELLVPAPRGSLRLTVLRRGDEEGSVHVREFRPKELEIRRKRFARAEDGSLSLEVESSLPARFSVRYGGELLGRSDRLETRALLSLNALKAFGKERAAELRAEGVDDTVTETVPRERLAPRLAIDALLQAARRLAAADRRELDEKLHDPPAFVAAMRSRVEASDLPRALEGLEVIRQEVFANPEQGHRVYHALLPFDEFECVPYFAMGRAEAPLRVRAILSALVSPHLLDGYPAAPDRRRSPVDGAMAMRFPGMAKAPLMEERKPLILEPIAKRIDEIDWVFELPAERLRGARQAEVCLGGLCLLPWLRFSLRVNGSLDVHLTGAAPPPESLGTHVALAGELGAVDRATHVSRLMFKEFMTTRYASFPAARFPVRYLKAGRNRILLRPLGNRWASPADAVTHGLTLRLLH